MIFYSNNKTITSYPRMGQRKYKQLMKPITEEQSTLLVIINISIIMYKNNCINICHVIIKANQ